MRPVSLDALVRRPKGALPVAPAAAIPEPTVPVPPEPELYRCYDCKTAKPASSFGADKARKSGLRNRCKDCCANYMRAYNARRKA